MPQTRIWEGLHALATRFGTGSLTGQTAVIVGASSELGLELARQLAHAGCKLALCARDGTELERARRELATNGAAVFARPLDATRQDQVEDFVHATVRRFGSLDILITCAGSVPVMRLENTHELQEAFEQVFWSAYYPAMAVLPHMREHRHGRIVHVGALHGTAESALTGFSRRLRSEVAADGLVVTAVTPRSALSTRTAARRILRASALRKAETTLALRTRLLVIAHAVAPTLAARLRAIGAHGRKPREYSLNEMTPRTGTLPTLLRAGSSSAN